MVRMWAGAVVLAVAALAQAGDWTGFRGPNGAGLSAESNLPTEWGADKNIAWKVKVPGVAWSCPIVVGDKVFVTTAVTDKQTRPKAGGGFGGFGGFGKGKKSGKGFPGGGKGFPGGFGKGGKAPDVLYRWEVHCLDRSTGKTLWKQTAVERKPTIPTHSTNTYASETPVTDGERVYAYFGMTGVFCYDLAGKLLWKQDLGAFSMQFGFGTGSSPVLLGDRLFIQCDNEQKSFLVALDKKTGKELWRVPREARSTWSTPFVWQTKARTELVVGGGNAVISHDPATGKVHWQLSGLNAMQFSATPVADEETLYFGCGGSFGTRPLVAIKAGASGTIRLRDGEADSKSVAWVAPSGGPSLSSPLLYRGHLYIVDQSGGLLRCIDAKTGNVAYRQRLPQARGFTASPWAYDGKIFCLDEDGKTFVIEAGPKYKLLATNRLGEMFWSSPAIAGGALYLRGVDHLYCVKR